MKRNKTETTENPNPSKLTNEGFKTGEPRYDTDLFPVYDKEYQRLAAESSILNDKKQSKQPINTSYQQGCEILLMRLEGIQSGDNKGTYYEGQNYYQAYIHSAKARLRDVHVDFKTYQQKQVAIGNAMKPPEQWPQEHLKARLEAEAYLDARRAEVAKLKELIEEYERKAGKKAKKKEVLPLGKLHHGLRSDVAYTGGIQNLDGQHISKNGQGIPYIDDSDSPYSGMPLFHYFRMVREWKEANKLFDSDINEQLSNYREAVGDSFYTNFSSYDFKELRLDDAKREKWHKDHPEWPEVEPWPSLPEWPEDAKNINEIDV